MYSWNWSKV